MSKPAFLLEILESMSHRPRLPHAASRHLLGLLLLALPLLLAAEQFGRASGSPDVRMGGSLPLVMEGASKRLGILGGQTFLPHDRVAHPTPQRPRPQHLVRLSLPEPVFAPAGALLGWWGQRRLEGG